MAFVTPAKLHAPFFPHAQTKQRVVTACQINGYCYMSEVFLTMTKLLSNPPECLESAVLLLQLLA